MKSWRLLEGLIICVFLRNLCYSSLRREFKLNILQLIEFARIRIVVRSNLRQMKRTLSNDRIHLRCDFFRLEFHGLVAL